MITFFVGCSTQPSKTTKKAVKPQIQKPDAKKKGIPLAETVNVFPLAPAKSEASIQDELDTYERAKAFFQTKQYDKASIEIKKIDKSAVRQIRVHARFLSGEIMFASGEYDLAMQIYEDIVQNSAFSGLVIPALKKLVTCSEKLKLEEKRERYQSLLQNTFES